VTALLLEPHQDDAILFASYLCLTHRPQVVTVLGDARNQPGVTGAQRDEENARAFRELGIDPPVSWPYRDDEPDWEAIVHDVGLLERRGFERVFAPLPEMAGHEQHNFLGHLVEAVFANHPVVFYTTYQFGGPRTTGDPVPYEREWVQRKLRALACFESQILHGPVRFFTMGLDEYTRQP
jgi:LmbE family N-acetylglucosaminyl deacetylase